ncbi:alpha-L-fucosidase [Paenibacillus antibioticophila]|uniref:alpha-L-fucosidase n=1 Tax=Paenibacillus antibioticophila TaxID=1274374 RepID=A0A920CFR6_9BACL|nr:alpha-L-fucosidase [Paenibacillus antibioticophila]GIO35304.1 alpha-L-fucosidase [Paenibacillus antibioticophila]
MREGFVVPDKWKWFTESRYGLFIHWGPYAQWGRGEQVLFREHLNHEEYAKQACAWNPRHFDPELWAYTARRAGFKYACLTTRHHDGFCLWDSAFTDYSSAKQAAGRDFVKEYTEAFRKAGLRIGLYYSWIDWRLPAYFDGPQKDPEGWEKVRTYLHNQVKELLTNYGQIDHFFFDGVWPRNADDLQSVELLEEMRRLQPHILINNRLGYSNKIDGYRADGGIGAGDSDTLGDFGTPEHAIASEATRLWESCQVTTWRLWSHVIGERWRNTDVLLDMLCECAEKGGKHGGNLLLNVGPTADGQFPPEFVERALEIGRWLDVHGEAIYGTDGGSLTEFITRGRQTMKDNKLYLIIRFWDGRPELRLADLTSRVLDVELLTTGQSLPFEQDGDTLIINGLPREAPTRLFPVIRITCDGKPATNEWGEYRLWEGDPERVAAWARERRGASVYVDGRER